MREIHGREGFQNLKIWRSFILGSSLLFYVVASLLNFSLIVFKTLNDEFCWWWEEDEAFCI